MADRSTRLFANILNSLLLFGGLLVVFLPFMAMELIEIGALLAVIGLIAWIYVNIKLLRENGQSVGKKILGIKIVTTQGEPVALSTLIFRRFLLTQFLAAIPYLGGIFGLIDALMIFGDDRRCIHDHFADTIVVKA